VTIIRSQFSPSGIWKNPHVQTIAASKIFRPEKISTKPERLELADGDYIDVQWSEHQSDHIVALFHGLAGCIDSPYIQGAFHTLTAKGFSPVLMHWRGCSGQPNRLARAYHSGASDDIKWFVEHLAERFPSQPLYAIGYSLGGNALLKYLGEQGRNSGLTAAMAVSPPLVLEEGANKLNTGLAKVYQRYLLKLMRNQHERKRLQYPDLQLTSAGANLDTFWKFDDAITAPLHGFKDVYDYYFTAAILPTEDELSDTCTLELSDYGGHVGFLKKGKRWLDDRVSQVLANQRSHHAN